VTAPSRAQAWRVCGASLAFAPVIAAAGPPFLTDDPEPVDFGQWEINTAATGSWRAGSASLGVPSVDINYGVAPNVQLHAQPRFSIEHDGAAQKGFDDTEVGVKYRFYEDKRDDRSFMLGIYPMYQVATGARRLGTDRGTHGVFLPVWAQYDRAAWTLYGGGGYRINHGPDARNSTFTGVTILRRITQELQLGVEAFRETATAIDARPTRGFNVGGARVLSPHFNVLFSAGRSFGDAASTLFYVGVQAHF
jgi:hypothetical protein